MKTKVLIVILFLSQNIFACTCGCTYYYQNLCEILNSDQLNTLVEAVYLESAFDFQETYKLRLLQNWYGPELLDTIFYISMEGSCDEAIHEEIGDTLLINVIPLRGTDTIPNFFTAEDTLALHSCRALVLKKQGPMIFGAINASQNQIDVVNFADYVNTGYQEDLNCNYCSCYCSWSEWSNSIPEYFCETLKLNNVHLRGSTLTARVEIEELSDLYTIAQIKDVIQGSEIEETIKIWHKRGRDCRSTSSFELNNEYIVSLNRLNEKGRRSEEEQLGDYEQRDCGITQLSIINERVFGPISEGINEIAFSSLQELIVNESSDCLWTIDSDDPKETIIEISPNPVYDNMKLKSNDIIEHVQIVDISGQYILDFSSIKKELEVDLGHLTEGIYLGIIKTTNGKKVVKICKM